MEKLYRKHHPSELYQDHSRNVRAVTVDERADKELIDSFVARGWIDSHTAIITPATDDDKAKAVSEREAQLLAIGSGGDYVTYTDDANKKHTVSEVEAAEFFRRVYCDKNGKVKAPKFVVVTTNRRNAALVKANIIRQKLGLGIIDAIPCLERDYAGDENQRELARIGDMLDENTDKGRLKMSAADMVRVAKMVVGRFGREVDLARMLGSRHQAQKLYNLAIIDAKVPELELCARLMSGELSLSSQDKEIARDLKKAILEEDGAKVTAEQGKAQAIDTYSGNTVPDAPKKIASKKDIKALHDLTGIAIVKEVCSAILANDTGRLAALEPLADQVNAVFGSVATD